MTLKIAIVHSELKVGGGSEARALWLATALQSVGQISIISMGEINLERLNTAYGTDLRSQDIEIVSIPVPRILKNRFDAFRTYRLARYIRRVAPNFDLIISAYNVMDFGRKGIQFIADFSFDDQLRRRFHPTVEGVQSGLYKKTLLRTIYLLIGKVLSGTQKKNWLKNTTVANSVWSRDILRERYGLECEVIYPPVTNVFPAVPWELRENGFVLLGRISPEKQIEKVISILGRVKDSGHNIHLHILGRPDDSHYTQYILELCRKNADWIYFEGLILGEEKARFIATHRYGISGCRYESFGIAVAEMVKAGCLVWVPRGGGQVEIVENEDLIFNSDQEAVDKIIRILESETKQNELRAHLKKQADHFSSDQFVAQVEMFVQRFLDEKN